MAAEFDEVLNKICTPSPIGNKANAYAIFETTEGLLAENEAPSKVVYVGSGCNVESDKGNKARHRKFIEDVFRQVYFLGLLLLLLGFQSETFHGKIRVAKKTGRQFHIVDLLVGICSDRQVPTHELEQTRFDAKKDKWDRSRHTVEDAFKTVFGRFYQANYLFHLFRCSFWQSVEYCSDLSKSSQ
jgi:hypothetical protein